MTDEEKQAIDKLYNGKKMDLISIIRTFKREGIEKFVVTKKETIEIVLNLIAKQQVEIEVYKDIKELADTEIKEILNWKYENKKLKSEIENLQKALATYTAHTVCSDIKQSYKHKEDLEMLYKGCQIELEEKDKIIDEMAKVLADYKYEELICMEVDCEHIELQNEGRCIGDEACIKEYFKKKVEDK